MAIRLALDLGLNLDSTSLTASEWLTPEEVELRRWIYWSIYCDDKLASMYTGRVCTVLVGYPILIGRSTPSFADLMQDYQANVNLPAIQASTESSDDLDPYVVRRYFLGKILRALVGLSRIMERILCTLSAITAARDTRYMC